uniref:Microtubule-associated protein 1B/S N-terminal domain-containing protein n=1 Tax=Sander lucioperca TaxID=283035 RepID=A0A8D0ALX7_SANLU
MSLSKIMVLDWACGSTGGLLYDKVVSRIRSWDVDLKCCNLDQQLQLFITRHSAHFSSEVKAELEGRGCNTLVFCSLT